MTARDASGQRDESDDRAKDCVTSQRKVYVGGYTTARAEYRKWLSFDVALCLLICLLLISARFTHLGIS